MPIYWTLNQVPGLKELSKTERQQIHKKCVEKYAWRSPACVLAFLLCICIVIGGIALARFVSDLLGMNTTVSQRTLSSAVGGGVGGAIAATIWLNVSVRELRSHYPEFSSSQ